MTAGSSIDYDALTQDALRGVVRTILAQVVAKGGLPGDHHFYIAFDTKAPDVVMSRRLKEKYPEEMMIVLQHRFWDLAVTEEAFEVKLTFDGIPERLYVPFQALRVFFDPSVRFTLQFGDAAGAGEAAEGGGRRRPGSDASGRQAGDRRGRQRPARARSDEQAETQTPGGATGPQAAPSAPSSPPTVFAPRPVAVPSASPASVPNTAPAPPAIANPAAKDGAGAKVFTLDQFRKK